MPWTIIEYVATRAILAPEVIPLVPREAKLAGFVLLLVVIFIGARLAGAHLGPVTTSHSHISYTGTTGGGMPMNMNMNMNMGPRP